MTLRHGEMSSEAMSPAAAYHLIQSPPFNERASLFITAASPLRRLAGRRSRAPQVATLPSSRAAGRTHAMEALEPNLAVANFRRRCAARQGRLHFDFRQRRRDRLPRPSQERPRNPIDQPSDYAGNDDDEPAAARMRGADLSDAGHLTRSESHISKHLCNQKPRAE